MNKVVWLSNHGGCFPFEWGFCPSERAFRHALREMNVKNAVDYPKGEGCTMEFEAPDGDMTALVTIGEGDLKRSPVAIFALLAHEAVHVFDLLCRSMGEKRPSDEFKAFSIQMFTSQLIGAYIRTRRPKLIDLLVKPELLSRPK